MYSNHIKDSVLQEWHGGLIVYVVENMYPYPLFYADSP